MREFNPGHKAVLDQLLLDHPLIKEGSAFGLTGYYAGAKLCICLYENYIGLKVPDKTAQRLLTDDEKVTCFQPYGKRRMREWVQIELEDPEECRSYESIFTESVDYVLSLQGIENIA